MGQMGQKKLAPTVTATLERRTFPPVFGDQFGNLCFAHAAAANPHEPNLGNTDPETQSPLVGVGWYGCKLLPRNTSTGIRRVQTGMCEALKAGLGLA